MIFVTVGEQLPFDRLIRTVDSCALHLDQEVFAQIGQTEMRPVNIGYKPFLEPKEFRRCCESAEFIIAHAGMGTIIMALELGKPLLVMPRRVALAETRNDHQVATAKRFLKLDYISVAFDEKELEYKLFSFSENTLIFSKRAQIAPSAKLLQIIREFVSI